VEDRPHLSADSLRWFWSMTVNGPMTRSDRLATLEEVRRSFRRELGRLEGVVIFRLMLVA
jgi:hypothetical protein